MLDEELYEDREQTLVKHVVLRSYLQRFAHIIGSRWSSITYVDCFSGPWNVRSTKFEDSSFSIALEQLREARDTLSQRNKDLRIRCFFLEKDREACDQLEQFVAEFDDVDVRVKCAAFENSIDDIVSFVREDPKTFPFVFVDPTGWTGIEIGVLRPLLRLKPGEILINFMTKFIRRFVESPDEKSGLDSRRLFGSDDVLTRVRALSHPLDREDCLVEAYCERIREEGGFQYVATAVILEPQMASTHFHLIYATRHWKGLEVFKKAEKEAMLTQERARVRLQFSRGNSAGQLEFDKFEFTGEDTKHYSELRYRFLQKAKSSVESTLRTEGSLE